MPLTPQLIDAAVERYWRECDRYQKLSECIGEACRSLLEEHSICGKVEWRRAVCRVWKHPSRIVEDDNQVRVFGCQNEALSPGGAL
jgi:hypothetical protein